MKAVVDAAVEKAYGGARQIHWMEIYAGEKATRLYGSDVWLPDETLEAAREYSVSIKGPMTTPVGGGIRSLNVALRQELDLFVCLRPGAPLPRRAEPAHATRRKTDMVIFRENTEDIYAGIEWEAETDGARKVIDFLQDEMGVRKIRFPETSSIGIKPVSREGTERLVRKAIRYALDNGRDVGHARPQGQHHEVHRGRRSATGATRSRRASSAPSRSTAARGSRSSTRDARSRSRT